MDFNSYIFILLYLPIVIFGYFLLGRFGKSIVQNIFLIIASLVFIGYGNIKGLLLLFGSIVVNIVIAKWIVASKAEKRHLIVGGGIILNVLFLGYFKYSAFFLENLNTIFKTDWALTHVLIPLGISFKLFQQIMFLVQLGRGNIENVSIIDYVFYISYFPKFVQGPITPYKELTDQLHDETKKTVNQENLSYGLYLFIIGLAKKVLLADVLAKAVSYGWANINGLTTLEVILTLLFFTLQIYFDFSGYSHMAIGVSKMLNISLIDNFDRPYLATSVTDFWGRWHISLTNFLREYIYFPLGGNRKGKLRTYINIMVVYLVSGLWHGAAWNYVLWGVMHGIGNCVDRIISPIWKRLTKWIQIPITFIFVNIAWVFFRAPNVSDAFDMLKQLFVGAGAEVMEGTVPNGVAVRWTITTSFAEVFHTSEVAFLRNRIPEIDSLLSQYPSCVLYAVLTICILVIAIGKDKVEEKFKPTVMRCALSILAFWWSILSLSTVVEFIYANF